MKRGVIVAKRLTDRDKKQVLAVYAETENYRETGRILGIDDRTVRKICKETSELSQLVAKKKEQNTSDMLAFMDSRKHKAQNIIDNCLDILPEKLERANAVQLATVMAILIDKFTANTTIAEHESEIVKIELIRNKDIYGKIDNT